MKAYLARHRKMEVFRLAYEVYVSEFGRKFPGAQHDCRILMDSFDSDAEYILAKNEIEHTGMCRINQITRDHRELQALNQRYQLSDYFGESQNLFYISRLLIRAKYRGSVSILKIIQRICRRLMFYRDFIIFIDCSPELVDMYEKLGFKRYCENFYDDVLGLKTPMRFNRLDINYHQKIGSPVVGWLT